MTMTADADISYVDTRDISTERPSCLAGRFAVDSITSVGVSTSWPRFPQADDSSTVSITDASVGWLPAELSKLFELQQLSDVWEEGGASRPNAWAIKVAGYVLSHLAARDFRPSHIDPSTNEGVCISFRNGARYADIECFNSGELVALTSLDDGATEVWELSAGQVGAALDRLSAFIG